MTRSIAVTLALLVAAAVVIVWTSVVHTLTNPGPRPPLTGRPRAIVWGQRVFTTESSFRAFLTQRGISYAAWARAHPSGVRLLRHEPATAVTSAAIRGAAPPGQTTTVAATSRGATTLASSSRATAVVARSAGRDAVAATGRSGASGSLVLTVLLALLGTAVALSAVVPERLAPATIRRLYRLPEHRVVGLAAALSIFVAMLLERP
jgi:hypothetical protein